MPDDLDRSVTRIVAISDTHRMHDRLVIPEGDILVHAGDFCGHGHLREAIAFVAWLEAQPHLRKVVIAGNHDVSLEALPGAGAQLFGEALTYLFDSGANVGGLKFYGSPWQPAFFDWAFNLPRGAPLRDKWQGIPDALDVLVTHGPPHGVLDANAALEACGCVDLRDAIDRTKPRVHIFGHIHEGYGHVWRDGVLHINASSCTVDYRPTNAPIVIDVPTEGLPVVIA